MNTADRQIADILAKYGEPFEGNVWRVQGTAVIYHKALERIAVRAKITFGPPSFLRAERDEAVILVSGSNGERDEWSIGEALVGVNYRVSGKQAAYVYAMAEKRAKDRVILKLINLHGLAYSEAEADEFADAQPETGSGAAAGVSLPAVSPPPPLLRSPSSRKRSTSASRSRHSKCAASRQRFRTKLTTSRRRSGTICSPTSKRAAQRSGEG
jgi:hypothetical protein